MSDDERWADHLDPAVRDADPVTDDDRAYLDRTRHLLADPTTWDEPPVGLEDRLLALAAATPQDHGEGAGDADRGATVRPTPGGRQAASRSGRFRVLAVAAAAAAAVVVFAVVSPQVGQDPAVEHYSMAGTPLAPKAAATVDVESKVAGDAITLHITGLGPAPEGYYYAGWLTGPRGTVNVGSFHWRKGGIPIELWSGVDTLAYPDFVVTLQQESPEFVRSDQVVLRGSLRP